MEAAENDTAFDPETCECCGMTYKRFRCATIASFGDAYHQIAWTREHTSRGSVLAHWGRCKREEWAHHVDTCRPLVAVVEWDFDPSDFQD